MCGVVNNFCYNFADSIIKMSQDGCFLRDEEKHLIMDMLELVFEILKH